MEFLGIPSVPGCSWRVPQGFSGLLRVPGIPCVFLGFLGFSQGAMCSSGFLGDPHGSLGAGSMACGGQERGAAQWAAAQPQSMTRACSCSTVDGNWTAWTDLNICSVTCGNGTKDRVRYCTNPAPQGTGAYCSGSSEESTPCNPEPCPSPGEMVPFVKLAKIWIRIASQLMVVGQTGQM